MTRKPYFWTKERDNYLRKNYPHKLNSELAEHFSTTEKGIRKRAERLKLKKTKEQIQKARQLNRENKMKKKVGRPYKIKNKKVLNRISELNNEGVSTRRISDILFDEFNIRFHRNTILNVINRKNGGDKNNVKNKKRKTVMEKKMTKKPVVIESEEEETEEELIEHTVEIDDYLRAVIKIPKVLTSTDLKSLMSKANKLFNLSEVPIVSGPKRQYVRRNSLSDEEKRKLVERYDKGNDQDKEDLARKMGVSEKGLYQKVWTIKKGMKITTKHGGKKYSDDFVNKILKGLGEGKGVKEMADEVGMDRKKLYDLVMSRTGKKPSDFQKG